MTIYPQQSLAELRQKFNFLFPGLDIRFYQTSHQKYEGSAPQDEWDNSLNISEITDINVPVQIDLDHQKTIESLEYEFLAKLGMNIQIFRRSADLWLQTIKTDHWTLEVQNRKGLHSQLSK